MQGALIETHDLNFAFTSKEKILYDVNLSVPQKSVYGFLGPNGAGKTTTIRLLLGLLRTTAGSITLFGKDIRSHRVELLRRIGSLIEQPSLYGHLTGRENLEVFRLSYRCEKKRIDTALEMVDLGGAANKKAKAYSLGMKQRLSIAIALLHDPELLILDEPTNGLDPTGIIETRALIKKLNEEHGKTIVVSSHLLTEVEKMATHVGIIHRGRILIQGTLPELHHMQQDQSGMEGEVDDIEKAKEILSTFDVRVVGDGKFLIEFVTRQQVPEINNSLVQNGVKVYKLGMVKSDLENLFVQIIST